MLRLFVLAITAAPLLAQLKLKPAEPLREPEFGTHAAATKEKPAKIRPAILKLKPAADPLTYVEHVDASSEVPRTYRVPKVAPISRDGEGVALQGYDPITYFDRRPERGKPEFSLRYEGVEWRFTTAEHRQRFERDPQTYIPQYGGFCAYSIGKGYPATADPSVYLLDRGRIYLFFDQVARDVWRQSQAEFTRRADRNWPKLHRDPEP